MVLASIVCPAAFGVELWRALSGNALSWAYVFEWPLLLVVAVHLWRVMLRQDAGKLPARRPDGAIDEDDADLVAWRRYLAASEAEGAEHGPVADSPGGS